MISEGVPGDRRQSKAVEVSLDQLECCIALGPHAEGVACLSSASYHPPAWFYFVLAVQSHPGEVLVGHCMPHYNLHNHPETRSQHAALGYVL